MQPIETTYKGCRFRSSLEARWAVYFDAVGLRWDYEWQSIALGNGAVCLPDFWLKDIGRWAEVQPGPFSKDELSLCLELVRSTGRECLLLPGLPAVQGYTMVRDLEVAAVDMGNDLERELLNAPEFALCPLRLEDLIFLPWWPIPRGEGNPEVARIERAVSAALSARFEYGEQPRVE